MTATPQTPAADPTPWWRDAVVYQVYVRSFADGDGDGVGDLPGITARLPYLRDLGVDAVWLTPFYVSPQHDHGYDVADYRDVDPLFGVLADADALIAEAHRLGLKVVVDLVPNHTSDQHAWFQAALAAEPGSPERGRYLFRTGRGEDGGEPPNNWDSVFGGIAWERVDGPDGTRHPDGEQWFLHIFDRTQPDLDWTNPEVGDMFEDVLRFWLDRGADGFRVDVAHGLVKAEGLPDQQLSDEDRETLRTGAASAISAMADSGRIDEPMWDQDPVHDVYRRWHRVLASYDGDRMAVAEAWARTPERVAAYVRPDELNQAFNFDWLQCDYDAAALARAGRRILDAVGAVGGTATWVLENHDMQRAVTRYGGGQQGLDRARAMLLVSLALPGSAYLYQGEELGLPEVDVAPDDRQDPSWFRTGEPGRDGCRVPMPWSGETAPYGFGPGAGQPWIPQPDAWAALSVAAQDGVQGSTLELTRAALAARRRWALDAGPDADLEARGDLLVVRRGPLHVVLNCGGAPTPLPDDVAGPGVEVVAASGPVGDDGLLPGDTAVWLR